MIYLITGTSLLGEGSGWLVEGQSPLCEGWRTLIVRTQGNALPRPPPPRPTDNESSSYKGDRIISLQTEIIVIFYVVCKD